MTSLATTTITSVLLLVTLGACDSAVADVATSADRVTAAGVVNVTISADNTCQLHVNPPSLRLGGAPIRWTNAAASEYPVDVSMEAEFSPVTIVLGLAPGENYVDDRGWGAQIPERELP